MESKPDFQSDQTIKLELTEYCSICGTKLNTGASVTGKIYANVLQYLLQGSYLSNTSLESQLGKLGFCQKCIIVLEDLKNLQELLENTKKSINNKVTTLKLFILKNTLKTDDVSCIKTFRKLAVKEFRPFVKLTKLKPHYLEKYLRKRSTKPEKKLQQCSNILPDLPSVIKKEPKVSIEVPKQTLSDHGQLLFSDGSVKSEIVTCEPQVRTFDFLEDVMQFEPWNEAAPLDYDPLTGGNADPNIVVSNNSLSGHNPITYENTNTFSEDMQLHETNSVENNRIWSRPPLTMTQFAILAIKNGPEGGLLTHEIIDFISKNFPYYRSAENWKFLLRNALSCNSCFFRNVDSDIKLPSTSTSMSGRWTLDDNRITNAFKMKIIDACTENIVAYPERLNAMLQPLVGSCEGLSGYEKSATVVNYVDQYVELSHCVSPSPSPEKQWLKPQLKYVFLAFVAVMNLPGQEGTLKNICDFIVENYPFFKTEQMLQNTIFSTINNSRYFSAKPAYCEPKSIKWIVNYDKIKCMLTIIADSIREDLSDSCMAYPERLNDILRSLFENALSCDHLFFVAIKTSPQENMSSEEIFEFVRANFLPFFNNFVSRSEIVQRLQDSLFFNFNGNMKWSIADAIKERMKKELQYIITYSPATILRAITYPETITSFVNVCS